MFIIYSKNIDSRFKSPLWLHQYEICGFINIWRWHILCRYRTIYLPWCYWFNKSTTNWRFFLGDLTAWLMYCNVFIICLIFQAYFILGGSLVSEGATWVVAFSSIRKGAKEVQMSVKDYSKFPILSLSKRWKRYLNFLPKRLDSLNFSYTVVSLYGRSTLNNEANVSFQYNRISTSVVYAVLFQNSFNFLRTSHISLSWTSLYANKKNC